MPNNVVTELRTALTVQNFAQAVAFYRDALLLPVLESWNRPEGSGVILDAGRATLELLSADMAAYVDQVEVGRRIAGPVRLALKVEDSVATARKLTAAGAWEVAARYSVVNLNDNRTVIGTAGQLTEYTLGLNWYLNPNMRVQWNYVHGNRNVAAPNASGDFDGYGMQFHIDF